MQRPRGSQPRLPAAQRPKAIASAITIAAAATRREAEIVLESGSTTSQGAAKEPIPPVAAAIVAISPPKARTEIRCARSKLPLCDRSQTAIKGVKHQAKASASTSVGAPCSTSRTGRKAKAIRTPVRRVAMKTRCRAAAKGSERAEECTSAST